MYQLVYWVNLNLQAELESVDEQPNDYFMHLNRFREANGFSHEAFDPRA